MAALPLSHSDQLQHGEWTNIVFSGPVSESQLDTLLIVYCGELPIRRSKHGLQVLCKSNNEAREVSALANQILADIFLRDRIVERSVVLMGDLVEGTLCSVIKN